jgi:NAD(P)-dependent dehydrogenase (short-subunit alcohol dehydrogenase family)
LFQRKKEAKKFVILQSIILKTMKSAMVTGGGHGIGKGIVEKLLKEKCTVIVLDNNTGTGIFKPIDDLTVEEWNRVLSVNLSSMFYMVKFGKHLVRDNSAIFNIASTRALMSEPHGEACTAGKSGCSSDTCFGCQSGTKDKSKLCQSGLD